METPDPLSQLADIHLPPAVGFWPPAPGWWLLAAALLVTLYLLARAGFKALVRHRRKAFALLELERSYRAFVQKSAFDSSRNQAGLDFLNEINALLRRVALNLYPDIPVAGISGPAWLEFLDSWDQGSSFRQGPGKVLADGAYRPVFDADAEALHELVRHWLEKRYRNIDVKAPANLGVRKVAA
ncbi:MAG: DUF4381 domain-containing protein [Pseudomonadales bacterium]|nr:DUF4381 domain-containing protein [Pseudomonadales bacterium]